MIRKPLPPDSRVTVNGRSYVIRGKIAEGGFSLIYDAESVNTDGAATAFVIKEYFPSRGAVRDDAGRVRAAPGNEEAFERNLERFRMEDRLGRRVAARTHQAYATLEADGGYAVMRRFSEDICSLARLEEGWSESAPLPFTGDIGDLDPCFPDNVRAHYALVLIERLLDAVAVVHELGCLHLDITAENVICAERDHRLGRNSTVMLADYGCAVEMTDERYVPTGRMSYSENFAAPEVTARNGVLTPRTDLYSVGMLLAYLCVGWQAFSELKYLDTNEEKRSCIADDLLGLDTTEAIREGLMRIIERTVCDQELRYPSAAAMQSDVRALANAIPAHPVNPDATRAFTLYSLRSMLTGSEDTRYSWADELRDRRKAGTAAFPDEVYTGVSWRRFEDDADFLSAVLPEPLHDYLRGRIDAEADKRRAMTRILTGNYDFTWKKDLCGKIRSYGVRRLLEMSRTLLNDEAAFLTQQRVLFGLLGEDGDQLRACYYNCGGEIRKAPYVGLALLTLYALLGPDGFKRLLPSPDAFRRMLPSTAKTYRAL